MFMKWIVLLMCAGLALSACTAGAEVPTTQEVSTAVAEVLPPEVAAAIQNQISQLLAVPVESIQIEQVEKVDWPDGCLGLGQPNETCIQALTPGWLLVFNINGQEFRFRADETGTVVRQEP